MYTPDNDTRIYLYDCQLNIWSQSFPNYGELLLFLARDVKENMKLSYLHPFKTRYLNEINMGDDLRVWNEVRYTMNGPIVKEHVEVRRYMFVDANNRIIDPRLDYKKIQELAESESVKPYFLYWVSQRRQQEEKDLPEFRKEPVPRTGKRKHGNYIRRPQSFREKKQNADPETMQFVRPSRRLCHLPDPWDDERFRPFPKSWKDCTKRKHQWKEKTTQDNPESFCCLFANCLNKNTAIC